jgi:uncharacterized GH25 family protein
MSRTFFPFQNTLCILLLILLFLIPGFSSAHSIYIQSSRYKVFEGNESPLFFCFGHHFPVDGGIRSSKLKHIKVYKPGGDIQNIDIRNETCLHSYMVNYDQPGTYVLTAETNPGYYIVYLDKKGRERHCIKPKSAIADQAQKISMSLYSKQFTKTYVVCEKPSAKFPDFIGHPLELVPAKDISELRAGEILELKVYSDGQPYTGQGTWDGSFNGFSTVAEDNFYPKTKISGDTLRIMIPHPGRWYIRYHIKVDAQSPEQKKHYNQIKRTATLVFQIPNQPKRTDSKSD